MTTRKKVILQTFMQQIWNSGNFDSIEQLVAPVYEIKEDRGDPWEGQILNHATFKERVMYSRNAFPDLNFDIQELVEENDKVVAKWVMSGTHLGDLPQLPATNNPFAISGMTIYYFAGNKLCGHTQVFDQMAFLSQIGFFNR